MTCGALCNLSGGVSAGSHVFRSLAENVHCTYLKVIHCHTQYSSDRILILVNAFITFDGLSQ